MCGCGAGSGLSNELLAFHPAHLHHRRDLLPLLRTRVHACGVVRAGMQEEDALLWDFLRGNNGDFAVQL